MQTLGAMLWMIPDVELLPQPPRRPSRSDRSRARSGLRSIWASLRRDVVAGADEAASFLPTIRGYPY